MKRLFGILTAAAVLAGILTGCGTQTSSALPSAWSSPQASAAPSAAGSPYAFAPAPAMAAPAAPAYGMKDQAAQSGIQNGYFNTEEYDKVRENGFASVAASPVSTFSADVDTASYCNVRRMIREGYKIDKIPAGAVRTEEMLNYFTYDYARPKEGEPFGITAAISACPWNGANKLLVLGVTTKDYDYKDIGGCNYVFLIDTSGSMNSADKLGLLKESLIGLLENLGDKDRISIVTYAGSTAVLAEGVHGSDRNRLQSVIGSLGAGGSTNGGAGLVQAYALAQKYFIKNGVNRIIMCSDGDLNVGITSQSDLYDLVKEKRKTGVYLSVLGFGTGNYSDSRMETLADNGNGNYSYIDCIGQAKKVLGDELVSTLVTVAKDVKFQIEFNPNYVKGYRQLGYENRRLNTEDFNNDQVDAGEVGSGCCLTVAYELITADADSAAGGGNLKYQTPALTEAAGSGEWMTVSIRYKEPGNEQSKLLAYPIGSREVTDMPTRDWRFAAAVCQFAMLLRRSEYKGTSTLKGVLDTLRTLDLKADPYKAEFVGLVKALA